MARDKITAFPDGNSFVDYNTTSQRLLVGNSVGLLKVFNIKEPELEPVSIDINENITGLSYYGDKVLVTNTEGILELVDTAENQSKGMIYRSELPLRDATFINEGSRAICGGDDDRLIWIDLANGNKSYNMSLPDQFLNVTYNMTGELISVSLANGDLQIYSVLNESPSVIKTLKKILPIKMHTSMDQVDFNGDHENELLGTKCYWTGDGESLLIPTVSNKIHIYNRSDWDSSAREFDSGESSSIIDFALCPNNSYLAVLHKNLKVIILDFGSGDILQSIDVEELLGHKPINIAWGDNADDSKYSLNLGTNNGFVISIEESFEKKRDSSVDSLFLEEAAESDTEEVDDINSKTGTNPVKYHEEDSVIIDEEDDIEIESNKLSSVYSSTSSFKKRRKMSPNADRSSVMATISPNLEPYSPGSTPWIRSSNNSSSTMDRRYLFMNSTGYVWCVQTGGSSESLQQQSITVSFFDRSVNKDYHFMDHYKFDLCSMNESGALLACSGFEESTKRNAGHIIYRRHDLSQEPWERDIPLIKGEYITSVAVAKSESDASIIVVGSNLGFLRIFNLHGLCINLIKTLPIVTMIASSTSMLFLITRSTGDVFLYSIIDVNNNYSFVQHYVPLPLISPSLNNKAPLIKGIFFNEYNDPCLVGGNDDTLMILSGWRDTNNARWVPILNCEKAIRCHGTTESKKNWKSWPLGLYKQRLSCILLKSDSHYPGFPLPLPIELNISLPSSIQNEGLNVEQNTEPSSQTSEDSEESFLRSSIFGKMRSDSLNDKNNQGFEDEIMEDLETFSMMFDKSLLKLFASACQQSTTGKALSVAKLMKSEKALFAAQRIAERLELMNVASKIGALREDIVSFDEQES